MPSIDNEQHINRVYTKMSEGFNDENKANLSSKCLKSVAYFNEVNFNTVLEESESDSEHYRRIYSTNPNIQSGVGLSNINCQAAESEVTFVKEWLILHTDLIQKQNDDILDKDRQIFLLRQENERLKEHIRYIEKEILLQTDELENQAVSGDSTNLNEEDIMTQGSCEEDTKENIKILEEQFSGNENCSVNILNLVGDNLDISFKESQVNLSVVESDRSCCILAEDDIKELENELKDSNVSESECELYKAKGEVESWNSDLSDYNFSVNSISDFDPMKNLKMSIRRRRACSNTSNSSVVLPNDVVNDTVAAADEKEPFKTLKKKKRRLTKDTQILTSKDPYVTQAQDVNFGISTVEVKIPDYLSASLEVPRWRHKIYSSCYTMEGTEDLDDEVYNKRHMRLENDERRRKRWDVQRIREQRVIEKLKQRQERVGSCSKGEENESIPSLWPKVEEIKYLEVCEELPVSAFGSPIPKLTPSEFNLPWKGNPTLLQAKNPILGDRLGNETRRKIRSTN